MNCLAAGMDLNVVVVDIWHVSNVVGMKVVAVAVVGLTERTMRR